MAGFGINFVPGQEDQQRQPGGEPGPQVSPLQQAIRTLSLRLPRVGGAQALAPGALLNAPGGAGLAGMGGMTLEQLLMQLFGGGPAAAGGNAGAAGPQGGIGGPPTPRIIPGTTPGIPPPQPPFIDRTTPIPEGPPGVYQPGPYAPSPIERDPMASLTRLGRGGSSY